MCTAPILVRNKKYVTLTHEIRTSYLKVPCGQCDECLRKRAKDLFIRARFETEKAFAVGGCGFMCTLTYDNDNLPWFDFGNRRYMVFSKRDVQKFIKRLRMKLDRFFRKNFGCDAPDFKYLVTSEFGTDPTRTQRPHYHLIILFYKLISLYVFRLCFQQSLNCPKGRSFGRVFQCDPLDISRGGVRYTSKYILKDVTYNNQNNAIRNMVKFYTDKVSSAHGIIFNPKNENDEFQNKCIRSSKAYKKDIDKYVRPFRDMLQFYMCSNDFGCSAIIERYGESLFSLGLLNIDKLPYSVPKQVIQRLERTQGSAKRDLISKSVFLHQFRNCIEDVVKRNVCERSRCEILFSFAKDFIQPRYGNLYFVSPFSDYYCTFTHSPLRNYEDILVEHGFYFDNDFYQLRQDIVSIINLSNCKENLEFRAKLAQRKSVKERDEYVKRKRNK